MIAEIIAFIKAIFFLINLWVEKDKIKAEKKAEVGREIVDALKETDNKKRASQLNAAIQHANGL